MEIEEDEEPFATPNGSVGSATPSGSARHRRKTNSDGLRLTNSGSVSMSGNKVNDKYDASYRNSENTNRLLGRLLSLGQACGIIGVALFGADIPMEEPGMHLHILHILYISHIIRFSCILYSVYLFITRLLFMYFLVQVTQIACTSLNLQHFML